MEHISPVCQCITVVLDAGWPVNILTGGSQHTAHSLCHVAAAHAEEVAAGAECAADAASGYRYGDHRIVNLWRNRGDAVIWSLADFKSHLLASTGSGQAFESLWKSMQRLLGSDVPHCGTVAPLCLCSAGLQYGMC